MTFNLLTEPWIPVLYCNGEYKRVGIRGALEDAGRIRQIAASNPMDRLAILRFLLALLYWCRGSPPDERGALPRDSFPSDWFASLEDSEDCFHLLGQGKRFYQDKMAQRHRPATDLIQEVPTGNNFWHFRHATDGKDGLCLPCCAMGLLRLPLFSVSGLPNLKSGINGSPPVYVMPLGMSLLTTLLANWEPAHCLGEPAWVKPDLRPTPEEEVPLLTGLTLLSRRVLLHEPNGRSGVCMACGVRDTPIVLTCEFATAGTQENARWTDPHVVYAEGSPRKALRAPDLRKAGSFRMDRPWPDLLARIAETRVLGSEGRGTSLLIVGFATGRALNIDVWERTVSVPTAAPVQHVAACPIRQWQEEGSRLVRRARPPDEKVRRQHSEIPATLQAIRPHVEARVSGRVGQLMAGGEAAWQQAAEEYRPMMAAIAKSLSPGVTTAALKRRQEIGAVLPDMRP